MAQPEGVITKAAEVSSLPVTDKELREINKLALEPLSADDVFTFKVAMCDNEVDRAYEVFPLKSLKKMAKLFVGKTMIKDHVRGTDNQVARIYATELSASETEVTQKGEVYTQLVAHVYMLKSDANASLIADIKAGIKKEVSVGMRVNKAVCSICGTDNNKQYCRHYPSKEYDGQTCTFSLEEPSDAYELSFVAVPAQPRAGTTKNYGAVDGEHIEPTESHVDDADESLSLRLKSLDTYLNIEKLKGGNEE